METPDLTHPGLRKLSVRDANTTNFPVLGGHNTHYNSVSEVV